jgi:hypothetical protein
MTLSSTRVSFKLYPHFCSANPLGFKPSLGTTFSGSYQSPRHNYSRLIPRDNALACSILCTHSRSPCWRCCQRSVMVSPFSLPVALVTHTAFIKDDIITNITYIPSVPHSRPTTFQAMVRIPPRTTIEITMDVTKAFLRYTEHPPDAQRGWDLPPAIFTPVEFENNSLSLLPLDGRIYTSTLLVDLATPDFSMPYNVIIFTCTLTAAIFGNIFNLLTRKFLVVHVVPDKTH